ncbi:virulence RhuM family protein [Ponticaulis koreensis]|uniref:virulence RhuM family protein n=1 Tax=Ponticaulis koreensis TaxID=1123045 RepID=UPI0003B712C2|nr:virulence RhuM family protein [Ponticaulis koreensis]
MTDEPNLPSEPDAPAGEILLYTSADGKARVECRFEDESIWLSQALMAELFDKDVRTINEHLKNLYEEGELFPEATIRKFRIVRREGERDVTRNIDHYNLEAIVAVGFRVRSTRGTDFRRWANARLQEYLVKGFTMDDQRLKNPPVDGSGIPDYFDELLERIRDIRASERRVYLRVREIFALAADYSSSADDTTRFFQTIQNKLHFAATGKTAAEIIASRADAGAPNMGLTNWKNSPDGQIIKSDVSTAKNYLSQDEITGLNRIVVMWLDFAEDQAERRKQVFLKDWETKLDEFLKFNDRDVLTNAGNISHKQAKNKAEAEYEVFAVTRRKLLEAEGERAIRGVLEAEAKALPSPKKKPKK